MAKVMEQVLVAGELKENVDKVLTADALKFLIALQRNFNSRRQELLSMRIERQRLLDQGMRPDFLEDTESIRSSMDWRVAEAPGDLRDRRVEITGPVERKMMINALNSGAKVFMADFEDSLSPTWQNIIEGQVNLMAAVRGNLSFESADGKQYKLNDTLATLVVRPRGWHLTESHLKIDGHEMSASLFDFGLYFFHNARQLIERQSGPYFYLPKLESHLEARLWNDVFNFSQDWLGITRGTIRATVLIETILAAFEMDEILFELKEHASGLNAGRWDYIFSMIKKFAKHGNFALPDRSQITMSVPFMRAYAQLLVKTCHRRGAHAIGGMAAFIPSRKDARVNEIALAKVREDKLREVNDGFDGTWVAHPDLVPVAKEVFDQILKDRPEQKNVLRDDVNVRPADLLKTDIENGKITMDGFKNNIDVALQYIESWLRGTGAAAIYNLMEDAATAEIARAQLWQWIHTGAKLDDGRAITEELYRQTCAGLMESFDSSAGRQFHKAKTILDQLVLEPEFTEFLTIPAYRYLSD